MADAADETRSLSIFSDSTVHSRLIEDIRGLADEIDSDPRKKLGKYYSLDGLLPNNVLKKLNDSQNGTNASTVKSRHDLNESEHSLNSMLNDKKLTSKQKEAIAVSVLRDNGIPMSNNKSIDRVDFITDNRNSVQIDSITNLIVNRHNLRKPKFLQVVSEKSNIEPIQKKVRNFNRGLVTSYPVFISSKSISVMQNENSALNAEKNYRIAEAKR